jgi:hypothetical protein
MWHHDRILLIILSCLLIGYACDGAGQSLTQPKQKLKYIEVSIVVFPEAAVNFRKLDKSRKMTWHSDTIKNQYYDEYVALKGAVLQENTLKMINKFSEMGWQLVSTHNQPVINLVNTIEVFYYFRKEYPE